MSAKGFRLTSLCWQSEFLSKRGIPKDIRRLLKKTRSNGMNTLSTGDQVRLSKEAAVYPEHRRVTWTVRVVMGDYALVANKLLGTWKYPVSWLKFYLDPASLQIA